MAQSSQAWLQSLGVKPTPDSMLSAGTIDPDNTVSTDRLRDVNLTVESYGAPVCNAGGEDALNLGVSFCALGAILTLSENDTVPNPYVGYRRDTCNGDSGGPTLAQIPSDPLL